MAKTLIITEKTSVACQLGARGRKILGDFKLVNGEILNAKDYSNDEKKYTSMIDRQMGYLENDKYIIVPASGHLFELYQAFDYNSTYKNWRNIPFPFIPEPFKVKLKEANKAKKCYDIIKRMMDRKDVDCLISATDNDREGESIFALIYQESGCKKPVKRIWTSAWEEDNILKSWKEMKDWDAYKDLRNAGFCRMCSDWQLGANLTAKTTLSLSSGSEMYSVGRVQTAVLNEIVQRELAILNFKSKKFYKIIGRFKTKDGKIYEGIYNEETFEEETKAKSFINILKKEIAKVTKYDEKKENKFSPSLYGQTDLAIDMNNFHNIDASKTLELSQSLYESGYQTYPRTESRYILDTETDSYDKMLKNISSINSLSLKHTFNKRNDRIVNNAKVDSHSAIIPTTNVPNLNKLTEEQRLLYDTVLKRAISVNFPPAVELVQGAITSLGEYNFISSGRKEIERGWREVYDIEPKDTSIVKLKKGDIVEVIELIAKEVVPQPPKRYDGATILTFMKTCGKKIENEEMRELMKNKGIGTGATRANIISILYSRKYIDNKGKSIIPTEKGMKLIEIFPVEKLKNAEFTGELEYELYKVEKGLISPEEYMGKIMDLYIESCNLLSTDTMKINTPDKDEICKCPCGGSIVHKKGKTKEGKDFDFYGCSNYKSGCPNKVNGVIAGKKITEKNVKDLFEKGKTSTIKGFKKKTQETFDAKLTLKDGNKKNEKIVTFLY